jgi:hypothetical protein
VDIKCQFKGWRHSEINEFLNTSVTFDGHQVPLQRLKTFRNQRIAKYICHFWWQSNVDLKVECVQHLKLTNQVIFKHTLSVDVCGAHTQCERGAKSSQTSARDNNNTTSTTNNTTIYHYYYQFCAHRAFSLFPVTTHDALNGLLSYSDWMRYFGGNILVTQSVICEGAVRTGPPPK